MCFLSSPLSTLDRSLAIFPLQSLWSAPLTTSYFQNWISWIPPQNQNQCLHWTVGSFSGPASCLQVWEVEAGAQVWKVYTFYEWKAEAERSEAGEVEGCKAEVGRYYECQVLVSCRQARHALYVGVRHTLSPVSSAAGSACVGGKSWNTRSDSELITRPSPVLLLVSLCLSLEGGSSDVSATYLWPCEPEEW